MTEWTVAAENSTRGSGEGEWQVAAETPSRRGRRGGGSAPQRTGVGSSPENPVPRGQAVPVGSYGEGPDGSIQFRTANGWRLVRRGDGRPVSARPAPPPPQSSGRLPRLTAQGAQDTLATGVDLITNPFAAGATVMRGIAGGADWIGQHIDDPTNISGRVSNFFNRQADSYGPTGAEKGRRYLMNEAAPTTPVERLAYGAGAALPGLALGPGAVVPTALSAGGGYAAGEATRLLPGASEQDAEMASTVGSIAAPGLGMAAPRVRNAFAPAPIDLPAARAQALASLPEPLRALPPEAMARLDADLRAGTRPQDAAVRAVNSTMRQPIPMSRGQVSGLPEQQAVENAYRAGASGRAPAEIAQAQARDAQAAIGQNLEALGQEATGRPIPARGAGAAVTSETLNSMYDNQRNATNRAYTYARDASADAVVADASRVGGRDLTDQALNIMRRGGRVNEGETLMQWVARNGGIRDQGGELSALDAQLWHKGRPFQRKAVQGADGAGMTLEQAAVAAQEAGFLPERFSRDGVVDTRAQPADLIEAIRRELAGEPVRSQYNAKNQELAQHVRDLEEAAGAAGVDLGSMNNAQARAAIDNYFAGRENAPGGPPPQVPSTALDLGGRLREAMASYDRLNPDVASVFREVGRLSETRPSARLLYDARQRLSRLRGNDTEISAARTAIQELDRYISDALDAGAFDGEPGAVMAWRDALRERRTQGATFESGDLIQQLTEREFRSGARTTSVAPEDAGNRIFGVGNSWMNKADLARDLARMRRVLGQDSEGWNALRGEHFRRLMDAGRGPLEAGADTFSGRNFANAWRDARRNANGALRVLYTEEQIAALDRLAFLADRTTSPVQGGRNTSATATTGRALTREAIRRVLGGIPFAGPVLDAILTLPDAANARGSFVNPRPNQGAPRLDRPRGAPLTRRDALALTGPGLSGAGNRQGE